MTVLLILVLTLLASGLAGQAQSFIEKEGRFWVETVEGTLPAGSRLRVSSVGGIEVRGEASGEIRYQVVRKARAGSREEAAELFKNTQLTASRQGVTAVISLLDPRCRRCGFTAHISIVAPASTEDTLLETQGGELSVTNLDGRVNAETAGGSITMDRVGGPVRATTAGGNIHLGAIGGDIRCETAGGSIQVGSSGGNAVLTTSGGGISAGEVKGDLRAETAGGGIRAEKVGGRVVAGTSGGSIQLGQVSGPVRAETAGGSIEVASAPRGVRAETAGGDIDLKDVSGAVMAASARGSIRAQFLPGAAMRESLLETSAGAIVVWLPEGVPVTLDAAVEFGSNLNRIESEFPTITVRRTGEGFGPGAVTAEGAIEGGGPLLRIRNINGRIQIRKRR